MSLSDVIESLQGLLFRVSEVLIIVCSLLVTVVPLAQNYFLQAVYTSVNN